MSDPQPMLLTHVAADVLDGVSHDLERLGAGLCGDPAIACHHMERLQAIDLIVQTQRSIAAVLRAECPGSAIQDVGLERLRLQLSSAGDERPHAAAK